ncbi:hypothetical protein ACFFJY_17795 [Fictibacillus aquaticus]|nr:hypothetical protein [Fictibacillus aquaticus]
MKKLMTGLFALALTLSVFSGAVSHQADVGTDGEEIKPWSQTL